MKSTEILRPSENAVYYRLANLDELDFRWKNYQARLFKTVYSELYLSFPERLHCPSCCCHGREHSNCSAAALCQCRPQFTEQGQAPIL